MNGIQSVTEEICGLRVTSTQFPPMRAHKLLARLARVMGPALGEIANVDIGDDTITEFNLGSLGPALVRVFAEMDDAVAERLPLEILSLTTCIDADGTSKHELGTLQGYNAAFAGMGAAPYLVMAFALKVNYARFLDDLAAFAPKPKVVKAADPSNGAA